MIMKNVLLALLIFGIASCAPKKNTEEDSPVETHSTAFELSNLDTTVSPCEDFYQYAIGGWLKENPVPSTESRWSSFNLVIESNNEKLKTIMEDFSSSEFEKGSKEQQIGDLYLSLLDSSNSELLGMTPIQHLLDSIATISSVETFLNKSAEFRKIGVNSLWGIYIGQDDKRSDQYIAHLYQSGLGLPDQAYYMKEDDKSKEIQNAYTMHIQKMLELAKVEEAGKKARDIYDLEHGLAKISMTRVERRDPEKTYNKYAYEQLSELGDKIVWDNYFANVGLSNVDSVIVSQPDFIKGTNELLNDVELSTWKDYLSWRLINAYASSLDSSFVNENFNFYSKTLSGTKVMKPRWKRALSKVNGNLGELVGQAFVERHFSEESKKDVARLVENLRSVFEERINNLSWMSEETKLRAKEKLESFNKKIGYPDKWKDYSGIEISSSNPVQNLMNCRTYNFNYMMNKLGQPIDKDEWFMTPQTVNAYYSSSQNEIVFPAGILQPPFYDVNADDAINYGGIGAVIGHEFTHGFDDQGSKYDGKGNLSNWWNDEDRSQFEDRANLVVEQFNGFEPLPGLHVNGDLTLGENLADLGGATLAYYALEKELESKGKPEPIDGFTYQQRFFLGWAQVWHMNMTDEELRKRIATDPHSPGQYRVIGPLANMPEFAEAFNCSSGDQMVNADSVKAEIW